MLRLYPRPLIQFNQKPKESELKSAVTMENQCARVFANISATENMPSRSI